MKIGILYNFVEYMDCGLDIDVLSDNEVVGTVRSVLGVLEKEHEVIPVRFHPGILPYLKKESFDFVFNLCEGIGSNSQGESWVAALLDLTGIPYTGSDSITLGLCLDKIKTKQILIANGIPTPGYRVFLSASQKLDEGLKFPLIVKPSRKDGSAGIREDSVVKSEDDLIRQVGFILENYRQPALVEEYIEGREINASVIGNSSISEVLPLSEIEFDSSLGNYQKIVNYDAKWIEENEMFKKTRGVCPALLAGNIEKRIKELAKEAYIITGCRDYARVDFRLKDDKPFVLEVNPNPWIGVEGGFARSSKAALMNYSDTIKRILSEAVKRYKLDVHNEHDEYNENIEKQEDEVYETAHLAASKIKLRHIPLLAKWFNDTELTRYMDAPGQKCTDESLIESFLLDQEDFDLIVCEKESSREIGFCSIYNINLSNQSAEISYLIGEKQFRGKGYGKEIIWLLQDIAFKKIGLNSISASVTEQNTRSLRVFEKTGFKRVGIRRQYHIIGDEKFDEVLFEMLREDYMKA